MTFNEVLSLFARYLHRVNDMDVVQMCGLAEGTNTTTLKTTSKIVYNLYNQRLTKEVTDNISMTACAEQPISSFCYYLVCININGTVTVIKGVDNGYAIPLPPAGTIPIGAFKVTTDSTHTFTSGTTDLSATGITATVYDVDCGIAGYLINQAMRKMERKYNFRFMKVRTTYDLIAAETSFDNPLRNYKKLISIYAQTGSSRYSIQRKDIRFVLSAFPSEQTGYPQYITEIPETETQLTPDRDPTLQWLVAPIPDVAYTMNFVGYQYSPSLDGILYQSNWWSRQAYDMLVYAALLEAMPYLKGEDQRIPIWQALYQDALKNLIDSELDEQFSGSLQFVESDYVA